MDERQRLEALRQERTRIDREIRALARLLRPSREWSDEELHSAVEQKMRTNGSSLRQVSRLTGTSPATLSRFMRRMQVPHDSTKRALESWVEQENMSEVNP